MITRHSGVLAHVSSLPSSQGIGTTGEPARQFGKALADAGQRYWQMLPVGPTGYQDSPYQSPSTNAGNPLLIDLEDLVAENWLRPGEIRPLGGLYRGRVDFGALIPRKRQLLIKAAKRFLRSDPGPEYENFCRTPWLDEFATFSALKQSFDDRPWVEWPRGLALRQPAALQKAKQRLAGPIEVERAIQFFFQRQWDALHDFTSRLGIELIGDLPIFVAHDSVDVWSRPDLFHLGADGRPTLVAGVPPDYFSSTGQRWGNPLYRWDRHRDEDYRWWADRLGAAFARFGLLRIDHFRGFSAYWEIPASEPTAVNGRWVEGPGADIFSELASDPLPIIAEDLGIITPEVTALRQHFGFPGMRVAQFGFDAEADASLHHPHNYPLDVVAYTGTHDNDTAIGWFWGDNERHDRRRLNLNRRRLLQTTKTRGDEINWEMIDLVFESKASTAIVPVQDLFGLGSEARMNTPGKEEGNWTWRMSAALPGGLVDRLARATEGSDRT
ncbi:MAG: 4-alpha-glucanotransferase [Acidimicrobiia bacterium]